VEPPKIDLSENQIAQVKSFYSTSCQACHGMNMEGGPTGPALVNAGQYIFYSEFKDVILYGKGQMPGFTHVDEGTIEALYRYLGGNPRRFNFRRRGAEETAPEGPIVASGGVSIQPDIKKQAPMTEYPEGVASPEHRYTTDYDTEWTGLLAPPWSSIVAYDLNEGTIKWRNPIGLDSLYAKGDPTKGSPNGTQRKGMIVTSTGVVFSTAKGGKLYAFDEDNGRVLWETTLSYEANAQPSMYMLDGKQYLVINATSNFRRDSYDFSKKPGALPRGYVVYALPDRQ
jgi:quinoprotein glucose dehydrogenase